MCYRSRTVNDASAGLADTVQSTVHVVTTVLARWAPMRRGRWNGGTSFLPGSQRFAGPLRFGCNQTALLTCD